MISTWKEIKCEYVKKKTRMFFYGDRFMKLYENGCIAYFTATKHSELKGLLKPKSLISATLDGKDKIKIVTKEKTYFFKFSSPETAKDWVIYLNKFVIKSVAGSQ